MPFRRIPGSFPRTTLRRLRIWSAVAMVVFLGLSILLIMMSLEKRSTSGTTRYMPRQSPPPDNASRVPIGVYSLTVHDLNLGDGTYQYDGYVWVKFHGDSLRGVIELMNSRNATMTPIDQRDMPGFKYIAYRVKGEIQASYSMQHFPFDTQVLTLEIESPRFEESNFVFVPDSVSFASYVQGFVGIDPNMRVPDYDLVNSQIYVTDHVYPTDFGLPETGVGRSTFTRAVLEMHVQRQFFPYLTKFLFPIFMMLVVTYFVFFVPVDDLENKVVICATSLFTAVGIGLLQLEGTMHVGYLMTTDRFYVLSYIMILLAFMEIIAASNLAEHDRPSAEALDIWSRYLFFPVCFTGLFLIAFVEYWLS